MFNHVVMTRFNLATPGRELALRTAHDWLSHRFGLFENYCLPAMIEQTSRNFNWIIYFDENTPDEFRHRVEINQKKFPFVAYYTGLFEAEGWARSIRECFPSDEPLLLSTRLDNDDALARDFVSRLQTAIAEQGFTHGAYNFRNGLIRKKHRVYAHRHTSNAFFSLLEPNGQGILTASSLKHMDISNKIAVHQIEGPPAWMQIVHERNVSNKVRGWLLAPEPIKGRFAGAAVDGLTPFSFPRLVWENLVLGPIRASRDLIASTLRQS